MAATESTTIPRARGMRAPQPATPPRESIPSRAPRTTLESRTQILGEMIDAIGFIETACAALENNDKTAFAMPCLHQGIDMLRRAHDALERADAEALLRSHRTRAHSRRNRRRAS